MREPLTFPFRDLLVIICSQNESQYSGTRSGLQDWTGYTYCIFTIAMEWLRGGEVWVFFWPMFLKSEDVKGSTALRNLKLLFRHARHTYNSWASYSQFMWLDFDNPTKTIYLHINSTGKWNEKMEIVGTKTVARHMVGQQCFYQLKQQNAP